MDKQCTGICRDLESWYATPRGSYALDRTRDVMGPILDMAFGYHLLQIGVSREPALFSESRIHHCLHMSPEEGSAVNLVSEMDELPVATDGVDVVIAHHALEFADNPHQSLREMHRVLAPHGHLLIVGFNPYSPQGVGNAFRGRLNRPLWRAQTALGYRRVVDWLHLLGCEVESTNHLCSLPPSGGGRVNQWMQRADSFAQRHNWPIGSLYIVHAIKQVGGISRPVLQRQKTRRRLIGLVSDPAAAPVPQSPAAKNKPRFKVVPRNK